MADNKKAYPNRLRFDLGVNEITELGNQLMVNIKTALDNVVKIPSKERTFENTVRALAYIDGDYNSDWSCVYFPAHVSADKGIRDASTEMTKKLEAFNIEQELREDVYKAVLDYVQNNPEQVARLGPQEKRLLDKTIQGYERNGLALEEEKRNRIKEIKTRLSELSIEFNRNLGEDVTKLKFAKEELEGLPEDFFIGKEEDGKYTVTLKYPDLFPILEQCKVEETRKKMDFANGAKCIKENTPLLEEALLLRQEESKLLKFESHANYILDIRMAKNPEAVFQFLKDLTEKLETPAKRDIEKLLAMKKAEKTERKEPFDGKLNIWDWRYYDQLILQNEYQVDHEVIKDYFPLHVVTKGLLDVYQEILGLRFAELPKEERHVWHEDVQQFEVFDKDTNSFIGHFYLDLFPRDGKYGHAAEFDVQKGCDTSHGRQYSAAAMVANFTKPTETKPSLLKFDEVETYFHEFGHVMHELCTVSKYHKFSGTNVERDFVEAPSQMLENWIYEPEVLAKLSGHYQDESKSLPEELREKLLRARYVNEALKNRRQLHFGTFDMQVHTAVGSVDTAKLWAKSFEEVGLTAVQPGTNGAAGFGHIMGGYSAGYYGYLWSKVYSSDMFTRFKKEGVLNAKIGREYRDYILAPGGTRDAMESIKQFLKRDPNPDAFLQEIGAK